MHAFIHSTNVGYIHCNWIKYTFLFEKENYNWQENNLKWEKCPEHNWYVWLKCRERVIPTIFLMWNTCHIK
jgi:hypothetical protein